MLNISHHNSSDYIAPNYRLTSPSETELKPEGDWSVVESRVDKLKKNREKQIKSLNAKHGELCWRFAWQVEEGKYIPYKGAVKLYEEAYEKHLVDHPEKLNYLSNNARELYDNNPSNVSSGHNYYKQESKSTHLQDIAIRRVMAKTDTHFRGNRLIQVRSNSPDNIGLSLSPLNVPFHKPDIVRAGEEVKLKGVKVEDFWTLNRVLQVSDALIRLPVEERKKYVEDPKNFDKSE
jgi:hypothetical protein